MHEFYLDPPNQEPLYETIQPHNEISLEIKQNEAYLSLSRITLQNCPAYTTHEQLHMNKT